jgi:hypothetical protein
MEASVNSGFANQGYVPGGESLHTTALKDEEFIARTQYEAESYATGDRSMLNYRIASPLPDAYETPSRDSLATLEDDPDFQEFATKSDTHDYKARNVDDLPRRGSATLHLEH